MWVLAALALAGQIRLKDPTRRSAGVPPGAASHAAQGVGVEEHLGRPVDLNLTFIAENGYPVKLSDFFHQGRPVILDLIYYACPMLCNLILNGQTADDARDPGRPATNTKWSPSASIRSESFDLAREEEGHLSWHLRPSRARLAFPDRQRRQREEAGRTGRFHYRYDARQQQFAHAAAIIVLTPERKDGALSVRRPFPAARSALRAGRGFRKPATMTVEKILLFCYHYDPKRTATCCSRPISCGPAGC